MKSKYYWQRKKSIDALFKKIGGFQGDDEIVSSLAKYLCIIVSGFLETAVREIFYNYAQRKAHANVACFVSARLKRFRSPNKENIVTLAGDFSDLWREELEKSIDEEIKDALDSIVSNRHNIAHGRDVGLTFARISDYYKKAIKMIDLLETKCC